MENKFGLIMQYNLRQTALSSPEFKYKLAELDDQQKKWSR